MRDFQWTARFVAMLLVAILGFVSAITPAAARVRHRKPRHHHPKVSKIEPVPGVFLSHGDPIAEFHCVPPSKGTFPVVILLHGCAPEGFAVSQYRDMCTALARHGFYTMFIEYYGAAGTPNCSDLAMTPVESHAPETPIPDDNWMRYLLSARDSLAMNPKADTTRLGVIGFSFGGTLAVITAALNPHVIGAIVDYYGYSNDRVEDAVAHQANFPPTLILHGDEDRRSHVVDAIHLHDVIVKHQPAAEIRVYPGVEHAFNFHDAVGYDKEASADAWSCTLSFLDRHLK